MEWEPVIGLEIHVQARSEQKVFCACKNSYGDEPNTNVCPVCLAHPGILPVLNKNAVSSMIKAGLMTGCSIREKCKFDRKSYYYPDMPKNYQITQFDQPICYEGKIPIGGKGLSGEMIEEREIGLERIHLEEDVGKSTHHDGYSTVDYNRAGIPLMETVSHPDMRSADEAYAYVQAMQQIMRFGDISDCDQEKGQFRCDVNISIRPKGREKFGTKIEIKNLNSTRHIWLSINHEIERQAEILEAGGTIHQETRRWDDINNQTIFMRTKETADDYRYFPAPDLTPIEIPREEIESVRASLPMTPKVYRAKFVDDFKVSPYDAHVLTLDKKTADFFMEAAEQVKKPKAIANIMMNQLNSVLSDKGIALADSKLEPSHLVKISSLIDANTIAKSAVSALLPVLVEKGGCPEAVAKELKLIQENDEGALEAWVNEVLGNNAKAVEEYRSGKQNAIQFLMGQVMKTSRGKANPPMVTAMLKKKMD